jgi:hypothetical protein
MLLRLLLKKIYDFAKWACRSYSPFICFENVLVVGLRAHCVDNEDVNARPLVNPQLE